MCLGGGFRVEDGGEGLRENIEVGRFVFMVGVVVIFIFLFLFFRYDFSYFLRFGNYFFVFFFKFR